MANTVDITSPLKTGDRVEATQRVLDAVLRHGAAVVVACVPAGAMARLAWEINGQGFAVMTEETLDRCIEKSGAQYVFWPDARVHAIVTSTMVRVEVEAPLASVARRVHRQARRLLEMAAGSAYRIEQIRQSR